jgi:phage tail-like protein
VARRLDRSGALNGAPDYRFVDPGAPDLTALLDGIAVDAGALALAPLPADAEPIGGETIDAGALGGAAGVAVGTDGTVYLADPEHDRVLALAPCAGAAAPLPCLRLRGPRGVAVHPDRGWLLVADTGADRIVVVDLATGAVRGPWSVAVDSPGDLAVDSAGRVYAVHAGGVSRYDPDGAPDARFGARVAAGRPAPRRPSHVAVALDGDTELVLVIDHPSGGRSRVLAFDLDGRVDSAATARWRAALAAAAPAGPARAIAAGPGGVYVGDPAAGRVLAFTAAGDLVGAAGWYGDCAGLAIDERGRLVVHQGASAVRLGVGGSGTGTFRLGPIAAGDRAVAWRRLQVLDAAVPDGAHVRLFTLTADDDTLMPPPLPTGPGAAGGAAWSAAPTDALDCFVGGPPARYVWIGARLQSGPAGSPRVAGLRLEYDGEGWLRHLPALYSRDEPSRDLMSRVLAATESALDEEERLIEDMPLLFDAATAPDDGWLDWLAGWLAFDLEPGMALPDRREAVKEAFELEGLRGTVDGLRRTIALQLGVEVDVIEPAASASVWALGDGGLGFGTMLADADADGAVLGATAVLEGSHLQAAEDYGASLYAGLAHRFCVRALAADLGAPGARDALVRIVERERPAHAPAHVCVIEPKARVGFQATVGVDAIVGGGGGGGRAGRREGGKQARIGDAARVGAGARVG